VSNLIQLDFLKIVFMQTANIPVFRNIAMYWNSALSVYKIDYTLRCLEALVQYLHH